jgi:hypothetical protein
VNGEAGADLVAERVKLRLQQMHGLTEVAVDIERIAVLLQALGAILDRDEGWDDLAAAYATSPRVLAMRWPDGDLVRPWVGEEMERVAQMLKRLHVTASLAVMQKAPDA